MFWMYILGAYLLSRYLPLSIIKMQNIEASEDETIYRNFFLIRSFISLVLFHALQSLLLIGVRDTSDVMSIVQTGIWPIKAIISLLLYILAFFIPYSLVTNVFYISLFMAIFFILAQVIILIDLACSSAEYLVQKYEESDEDPTYKWILIGLTGFFGLVTVVGSFYVIFQKQESIETFFSIMNLLFTSAMVISSLLEKVQQAQSGVGIFPAFLISAFNTYLVFSAVFSSVDQVDDSSSWPQKLSNVVGGLTAFALILYMAMFGTVSEEDFAAPVAPTSQKAETDASAPSEEENESYNYSLFHCVFLCAAFYLLQVFTDWKRIDETNKLVHSDWSFRTKIGTSWILSGLYLWVLFAPIILQNDSDGYYE